MPFSSSQMSQMFMAQNAMFSGQSAYAQQLSYPMQSAMHPGAPPPPPAPPPMGFANATGTGQTGFYGEQIASRMAGMGQTALGVGTAAAGVGLGLAGLDPFSLGISTAMGVGGMGGIAAGLGVGAAAAVPMYVGGKVAQVYGGAFTGGMQEQAMLNSTLRQNFGFFGGQGAMGRGFSQQQMGQIGGMLGAEVRQNPFTSMGELNQLIAGGAQMGQFTGVRDVQEFSQRFRRMLSTLRDVQRELGGTLTDAMNFAREARQSGVFQQVDQLNFAGELRGAEATTGMNRGQLMALSRAGAQMSRQVGGYGRQGAYGALRAASTLGGAVQSGVINEELLSEATGGLTGAAALQQAVGDIMQRSGRFSRRGMGRYSLFAMSNAQGTGLNEEMMQRFLAGDITTGQVSRAAHRNVGRMGRARAINQEGVLRGAMMEQGGLAGQIGMMRLMVGDRVMEQGDDLASLVLQRRFRMNRPQAEMMMSLMRNQGTIAEQEAFDRAGAGRQASLQRDVRENRSFAAFERHLSHGLQDAAGVTRAREMGRSLVTRVSTLVERAMNDMLGIAENQISQGDRQALNRMAMGTATAADFEMLGIGGEQGMGGLGQAAGGADLFQRGLLQRRSVGQIMQMRGIQARGLDAAGVRRETSAAMAAREGRLILDRDRESFRMLEQDSGNTMDRIARAQALAAGGGDISNYYNFMGKNGGSANAIDAFLAQRGLSNPGAGLDQGMLMRRGGGGITARNAVQFAGAMFGNRRGNGRWSLFTGAGEALGRMAIGQDIGTIGDAMGLDALSALGTQREQVAGYLASGGELGRIGRRAGARRNRTMVESFFHRGGGVAGMLLDQFGPGGESRRQMSDQDRLAGLISDVSGDQMGAILGNRELRQSLSGITGAGSAGEAQTRLRAFQQRVLGMEDPGQRRAGLLLLEQMRSNMGKNQGMIGGRFGDALRSGVAMDPRRRAQLTEELADIGAGFQGMAGSLGEGRLGGLAGRIAGGYLNLGSMSGEDLMGAQQEFTGALAGMDVESDEYRSAAAALGQSAAGRAQLTRASNVRGLARQLQGRGRRGGRGAADALFSRLTGGALSEMEFTIGGRSLRGRNRAQQMMGILRRGTDEQRQQLQEQLTAQLQERGVEGAEGLVGDMLGQARGGMSQEQSIAAAQRLTGNQDLQRIQREALERRQRQQNPLDTTRNDLLQRIADGVGAMARSAEEGGVPVGESGS